MVGGGLCHLCECGKGIDWENLQLDGWEIPKSMFFFGVGCSSLLHNLCIFSLPSSHPIQKPQRRNFKIRKRLQYIIYAPFVGVISNLYTCPIVQSNFIAVAKGSSRSCNGQVVSRRNRSTLGQRVPNDSTTFGRW